MAGPVQRQARRARSLSSLGRAAGAAQHGIDARQQFARREGLGHVVVGAAIEACDLVALGGARGEHDDRQIARRRARA